MKDVLTVQQLQILETEKLIEYLTAEKLEAATIEDLHNISQAVDCNIKSRDGALYKLKKEEMLSSLFIAFDADYEDRSQKIKGSDETKNKLLKKREEVLLELSNRADKAAEEAASAVVEKEKTGSSTEEINKAKAKASETAKAAKIAKARADKAKKRGFISLIRDGFGYGPVMAVGRVFVIIGRVFMAAISMVMTLIKLVCFLIKEAVSYAVRQVVAFIRLVCSLIKEAVSYVVRQVIAIGVSAINACKSFGAFVASGCCKIISGIQRIFGYNKSCSPSSSSQPVSARFPGQKHVAGSSSLDPRGAANEYGKGLSMQN